MKSFLCNTVLFSLSLLLAIDGNAQSGVSNARSVGMGGAYTALARGVEAPSWNPANLGLSGKRVYHLNLFSLGIGIHNNSFTKKQYELYNGSYLTEQDKQDILNAIPAEGMGFDLNSEIQAFGINIGPLAFTASGYAVSDFRLSRDIADLVLNGNQYERAYDIGDTDGEGWGVSSFALSGGFPIYKQGDREVAVGLSVKYLLGFAYGNVAEASSQFSTDIDGMHGAGRLMVDNALGGSGFGFDVGVAANLNSRWTASLALNNVVNSLKWNKDTKRFIYTFTADSVTVQGIDDSDIDSVLVHSDEEIDIEPFSSSLPKQMRFGVARSSKRFTVAVDYVQGLGNGPTVSTKPMIALGTELRPIGFLPLRAGLAVGGRNGLSSAIGFAFDFSLFSWDFAIASRDGMFSGKGAAFAFNWMFRF